MSGEGKNNNYNKPATAEERTFGEGIEMERESLLKMQKELEMDLRLRLSESQYEVLKKVAEASGDTIDEYVHSEIIQGLESDIDMYFGHSKTLKVRLYKKLDGFKTKGQKEKEKEKEQEREQEKSAVQ